MRGDEVRPGDVITINGHVHEIRHIYCHEGWAWPVATDDTGWAMALGETPVDVVRHRT